MLRRRLKADEVNTCKVLFVATVYTHPAAFLIPFMKLLQSWGYEVHAAASPSEGRKDEVEAIGVTCWDIFFGRSATSLQNLRAYRELTSLLRQNRYDLIHVHTPMAAWLGRLAARRTGQGPVLYTAHGFHFYKGAPWPYWLFYYPAERLAARWTDGLIVMNGEDLQRARWIEFWEEDNFFLVHDVEVTFLPNLIEQLGLNERVQLVDFQNNVSSFLHALDIFIFPSRSEGFGQVLIEAMATGKPIVAFQIPPITEIVADGETGILVESKNSEALAQAISFLLIHKEQARKMGEKGQQRVLRHFTAERMADETLKLYREILERGH